VAAYERGLERERASEGFYQGLVRCHLALGHRAEALTAYERCRRVLADTLGVDPSAVTRRLARRARAIA